MSVTYGPLSIDEARAYDEEDDNSVDDESSPSIPPFNFIRNNYRPRWGLRCNRRRICIVLFILCMIISVSLVAMKEMFHLSLPNFLRIVFGGSKVVSLSNLTAKCIPSSLNETQHCYMNRIDVSRLNLTRIAYPFSSTSLTKDNHKLLFGFTWDTIDDATTKYRPQGVSTYHSPTGKRYALISWYGRKDEGYANRGGRISFVDISEMNNNIQQRMLRPKVYQYTHVLLVDQNFCTLPNIHVGGIEQKNGTLYVADSRKEQQAILEFDITNGLYELPTNMVDSMFGYRYVLRQSSSFHSPTKPSFIAYDNDLNKFVIGTYARCGKKVGTHVDSEKCFTQPKNRLVWLDKNKHSNNDADSIDSSTDSCDWNYFSEMQGAVSAKINNSTIIWISSSYGPIANSHLHVVNASTSFTGDCPNIDLNKDEVQTFQFPPGLEDLHIETTATNDDKNIWMITEFGARRVFTAQVNNFLPRCDELKFDS